MKLLLGLFAAALFFGCSTAPPRSPSREAMCKGKMAVNAKFPSTGATQFPLMGST